MSAQALIGVVPNDCCWKAGRDEQESMECQEVASLLGSEGNLAGKL